MQNVISRMVVKVITPDPPLSPTYIPIILSSSSLNSSQFNWKMFISHSFFRSGN